MIVTPAPPGSRHGNRRTALRWASLLEEVGHRAAVVERWEGQDVDLLLALHARRSLRSIREFASAHPGRPLVLALTGTDVYRDIRSDEESRAALELATRLVVLQPLALNELDAPLRRRADVVVQSAEPLRRRVPTRGRFEVLVAGHLRAEKDPLRAALAVRLLPSASRVRVLHAGRALDPELAEGARALEAASQGRYRWLGELEHERVRHLMATSRAVCHTSLLEGGANVISEALAGGVAVLASDIPGNVGLLGEGYEGTFPAGDERALADLLARVEADPGFLALLERRCGERRPLVAREGERAALAEAISAAVESSQDLLASPSGRRPAR